MKKYLFSVLFAILIFNSAHAQEYYYENDGYYNESPRYERQQPRYRRITNAEARQYQERQVYKSETPATNSIRPYIGIDVAYSKMELGKLANSRTVHGYSNSQGSYRVDITHEKSLKDKFTTGVAVLGTKINKYFGFEAFYHFETNGKKSDYHEGEVGNGEYTDSYKRSLSYHAVGLDLQGYMPLNEEIELIASLGLGEYYFNSTTYTNFTYKGFITDYFKGTSHENFDSLGIRLGLGAQYNFNEHFALRGMFRYVKMTDDECVKNLIEASLGLRYMF